MTQRYIIANRIRTPDGTVLQSFNRHDCKTYTDKNGHTYMVDGGLDYLRRFVVPEARAEEMSVYSDDPHELVREALHWGTRGVNGDQPLKYIALKDMTSDHINAVLNTQLLMHPAFMKAMEDELEFRESL